MKKLFFISIAAVLLLFSCKKIDSYTQFNIDYEVGLVFQSGSPISVPFNISTPPQETNSTGKFQANDTEKDKIEEIKLTKMYLQIESPSNADFSFLNEVEIFIDADGLSEISLAHKYNISNNIGGYLELDVNENDFKEYVKKDEFTLRVRAVQDEQILQDIEAKCFMRFFVDAKVLGV